MDIRDELEAVSQPLEQFTHNRVVGVPLAGLEDGVMPDVDGLLVVVCAVGVQSDLGAAYLQAGGARRVAVLEGGVRALRRHAEGEITLEFRVRVAGAVQALEAQRQLGTVPGVRQAGVAPNGLAVVRGTVKLEQLRAALPNLEIEEA